MNRRQMVILPGVAALAAGRGLSQTASAANPASTPGLSRKAMAKYSRAKYAYRVPQGAAKQAKYISFLTTLLSLSPGQQAEAASIFASASASKAEMKSTVKSHRLSLGAAVAANNFGSISQESLEMGKLAAQHHAIGAKANAALIQILSADQQDRLTQFRS